MILGISTYPDKRSAENAAVNIVEKHLAACVSIIKIEQSIYRWKGKLEKEQEYLLLMKTTKKTYPKLEKFVKQTHPHNVPEIIGIPIAEAEKEYLQWVSESTLSKLFKVPLDLSAMKRASDPSRKLRSAKNPRILS